MTTMDWEQPNAGMPPGGAPGQTSGWPSWIKVAIVLILLAALGWLLLLMTQYLRTNKPIQDLPGIDRVRDLFGNPPSYVGALDDIERPLGVAVDRDGTIYVTESAGERMIRAFDPNGEEIAAFAPPAAEFPNRVPLYVAVSRTHRVYVSDRFNDAIHIFTSDGEYVGQFEPDGIAPEEWHPMGVAFDRQGNLYVTDVTPGKHRVLVFDSFGDLQLEFGMEGKELGEFWYPNGIAVDGAGRIFVADGNNGRLQVFDSQGRLQFIIARGFAGGDLSMPRGIALDGNDRLLVADTSAHIVKVYDITGEDAEFIRDIGAAGSGAGEVRFPNGVALANGRLYVTDRENGRVQIWSY